MESDSEKLAEGLSETFSKKEQHFDKNLHDTMSALRRRLIPGCESISKPAPSGSRVKKNSRKRNFIKAFVVSECQTQQSLMFNVFFQRIWNVQLPPTRRGTFCFLTVKLLKIIKFLNKKNLLQRRKESLENLKKY